MKALPEADREAKQRKVLRRVGKALVKACKSLAYYCVDCRVTKVDEFGCCSFCGQDVVVEPALVAAERERRMKPSKTKPRLYVVGGGA